MTTETSSDPSKTSVDRGISGSCFRLYSFCLFSLQTRVMAGHYQSPSALMAVAMEEINMSCDQRQNDLEESETAFRLPPGYPCGPKPKKVINGKGSISFDSISFHLIRFHFI